MSADIANGDDAAVSARFRTALLQAAAGMSITLEEAHVDGLTAHYQLLVAWNRRINLTRLTDPAAAAVRHVVDSLMLLPALPRPGPGRPGGRELLDLGTGAGFPGIPLKIVRPEWRLTLVDAVRKKTGFLRHLVGKLGLRDVVIIHVRAETLGQDPQHRERYGVVVARAVAAMAELAEYALPLTAPGGRFLAMRGQDGAAEVEAAEPVLQLLGGRVAGVTTYSLPDGAQRTILVISKEADTPPRYPRRPGVPRRSPLTAKE